MYSQTASYSQSFLSLLDVFVNAAAALPLVTALGLIAGRRGNGAFCIAGNHLLLKYTLLLSICGAIYFPCSCFFQIMAFTDNANPVAALGSLAGLPWTTSLAAWLCGMGLLASGIHFLGGITPPANDRYTIKFIKLPLICCLGSALCFFATYILINWPFAGLPAQLPWDRAIMAIFRNATRHYFMAFCPAGAIGLIVMLCSWAHLSSFATTAQCQSGRRWLAFWAAIGFLPNTLQKWGLIIGLAMSGNSGSLDAMHVDIIAMILLSVAICCWFWLLLAKKARIWVAYAAFTLLLARTLVPVFVTI